MSAETKVEHTPGPWRVKQEIRRRSPATITSRRYVGPARHNGEGAYGEVAHILAESTNPATAEANARLIAAAPDLLEALESIENDDGRIPPAIWEMRNRALAKARGES